jgi:hypothetical protein
VIQRDMRATAALHQRLQAQLGERTLDSLLQRGRRTDARAAFAVARLGIERLAAGSIVRAEEVDGTISG